MTEVYAYLVSHTHRTWFGLRRHHYRTVLALAKPVDSMAAFETLERLVAGQLRVHPSDLAVTGLYPLNAPAQERAAAAPDAPERFVFEGPAQLAVERLHTEARRHALTVRKLTATDIGLFRARALLEALAQECHPRELAHLPRAGLGQLLHLVRGELDNYPNVFPAGLATLAGAERVLEDTAVRWDRSCLVPLKGAV